MSVTSWFLVAGSGTRHRLPKEMIFVGRDECELMLQSRSVDRQHAVVNYDPATDEHKVMDLGSLNGTFVNESRIPEHTYLILKLNDTIRFGYDPNLYTVEKIEHKVPEEALKHEKYSIQLQLGAQPAETRLADTSAVVSEPCKPHTQYQAVVKTHAPPDDKASAADPPNTPPLHKTPLYGQPSWWSQNEGQGLAHEEGDHSLARPDHGHTEPALALQPSDSFAVKEIRRLQEESNGKFSIPIQRDSREESVYSLRREPSYFEIPTKDFQQLQHQQQVLQQQQKQQQQQVAPPGKPPRPPVHEAPTRDVASSEADPTTQAVVQSHASFTIEFDSAKPGRVMIKDRAAKFAADTGLRQRPKPGPPSQPQQQQQQQQPAPTVAAAAAVATAPSPASASRSASSQVDAATATARNKVHDWLAQQEPIVSMIRKDLASDDVMSTKSDVPVHGKVLKGSKHRDGTRSDDEADAESDPKQPSDKTSPVADAPPGPKAFTIEFFDEDHPRKKRSSSFTHRDGVPFSSSSQPDRSSSPGLAARGARTTSKTLPHPLHQNQLPPAPPPQQQQQQQQQPQQQPQFFSRAGSHRAYSSMGRRSKVSLDFQQLKKEVTGGSGGSGGADRDNDTAGYSVDVRRGDATRANSGSRDDDDDDDVDDVQSGGNRGEDAGRGEEDNHSDAGTYTIESEIKNKEEEKARSMIDQVFGVSDPHEYPGAASPARPASRTPPPPPPTATERQVRKMLHSKSQSFSGEESLNFPGAGSAVQASMSAGSPRWVSRWASLAATHATDQPEPPEVSRERSLPATTGDRDVSVATRALSHRPATDGDVSESAYTSSSVSLTSDVALSVSGVGRRHRTLPQAPERPSSKSPDLRRDFTTSDVVVLDKRDVPDGSKRARASAKGAVVNDARPSSHTQRADGAPSYGESPAESEHKYAGVKERERGDSAGSWTVSSIAPGSSADFDGAAEGPRAHTHNRTPSVGALPTGGGGEEPLGARLNASLARVKSRGRRSTPEPAPPGPQDEDDFAHEKHRPLQRKGSFTKERPSSEVPLSEIPQINGGPGPKGAKSPGAVSDTAYLLKDTEAALHSLEAKLHRGYQEDKARGRGRHGRADDPQGSNQTSPASLESDADTASSGTSASLVADSNSSSHGEQKPLHRRRSYSSLHREKAVVMGSASADPQAKVVATTAGDLKHKGRRSEPSYSKQLQKGIKAALLATGEGADDDDDEDLRLSRSGIAESYDRSHAKSSAGREDRSQRPSPGSSTTISKPRPTRASILRRARLGDASDNDAQAEVEASNKQQASTSKRPPSRLDILAQPRRRTGSFTARSTDAESLAASRSGGRASVASGSKSSTGAAGGGGVGAAVAPGAARSKSFREPKSAGSVSRSQSLSRGFDQGKPRSSSVNRGSAAGTRWRRCPTDYTSTSEEDSSSPKHATAAAPPRVRPSPTAVAAAAAAAAAASSRANRASSSAAGPSKRRSRLPDDDDYIRDWNNHSEEIARISQDLAKDLAILAREIHEVAGTEPNSVSSSSSAAGVAVSDGPPSPGSTIEAKEQLVQRIADEAINFRKVPPHSLADGQTTCGPEAPYRAEEGRMPDSASKRKTWTRDEMQLDNLILSSVAQLSQKIRSNTDRTATKMRILLRDEERNWPEIESRLNSDSEVPLLKTSNKDIASILRDLRTVERQLEVINAMIDPDNVLDRWCDKEQARKSAQGRSRVGSRRGSGGGLDASLCTEPDSVGSEAEYSIHFNKFHPSGEEDEGEEEGPCYV
ncbi:centrosomal protein of 170 kDa-like isoform X3 [Petromyzon marinus]|uniref:Centrosomal protein of 170 kDa-like isoform X3 n=1 Tax=Petromyzon marinus TaxID=7757 RepID=A0AAJ7WW45_PETMA|nr:centrosomal protein of 170 kDa-like isoform X3 [Petromyzon marinus]